MFHVTECCAELALAEWLILDPSCSCMCVHAVCTLTCTVCDVPGTVSYADKFSALDQGMQLMA